MQLPEPQTAQQPRPDGHAAVPTVADESTRSQSAAHEGGPGPLAVKHAW